jgi:hypothetical protein
MAQLGAEEGMCALIRNGSEDAIFIAPPAVNADGSWFEHGSGVKGPQHSPLDMLKAGYEMKMVMGE